MISEKPISSDCTKVKEPMAAANTIFRTIILAIKRRESKTGLANDQFAFLYFHGTSSIVSFDNEEVRNVLTVGSDIPFPFVDVWPNNAQATNFLFATPSGASFGVGKAYTGHPETKLLQQFPAMANGYLQRDVRECPCYVILGTIRDPCNFNNEEGCAVNYVKVKLEFSKLCRNTMFYLFVHRKVEEQYQKFWENTVQLMKQYGINVLHNNA